MPEADFKFIDLRFLKDKPYIMGVLLTICVNFIFHVVFHAVYVVHLFVCFKTHSIVPPTPILVPDCVPPVFIILKV